MQRKKWKHYQENPIFGGGRSGRQWKIDSRLLCNARCILVGKKYLCQQKYGKFNNMKFYHSWDCILELFQSFQLSLAFRTPWGCCCHHPQQWWPKVREDHVTKYCCYAILDRIGHLAISRIQPNMHSELLDCFRHVHKIKSAAKSTKVGRVPNCHTGSVDHTHTMCDTVTNAFLQSTLYDCDVMGKAHIFCNG